MTQTHTPTAEMAERCERATGPDKVLNRAVARAIGWGYKSPSEARRSNPAWFHPDDCRDGVPVMDSLHGTDIWREPLNYVGSLDAAMTLAGDQPNRVLNEAMARLAERFGLHMCFWPKGENYIEWLARFVTAAALRSHLMGGSDRDK